jgi:trimeric autotransporter adhesin
MKKIIFLLLTSTIILNVFAQKPKLLSNANSDNEYSFKAAKINNKVIFQAFTNTYGNELWVTDGTLLGTTLLKDIIVGTQGSYFNRSFIWNGELYFTAYTNTNGDELWKTDGTSAGTVLVFDIVPGTGGSNINSFAILGSNLYFLGYDIDYLSSLYKYDGTNVTIIQQNAVQSRYSQNLQNVNGSLYFNANDYGVGAELWKSDGTIAGTSLVKSIANYQIGEIGGISNEVFFTIYGATSEVWKSNGTTVGTVFMQQTNQTYGNGSTFFQVLGGVLYFSDNNKIYTYASGVVSTHYTGSNIKYFKSFNSEIVFVDEVFLNQKLFKIIGTSPPVLIKEFMNGSQDDDAIYMEKTANGTIYMSIEDETNGHEIWKSDGTTVGAVLVKNIENNNLGSFPKDLVAINNQVIFFAKTQIDGYEPWITDGTNAGTVQIKNIQQGVLNTVPRRFIVNGNYVHFSADNSLAAANAQYFNGTYIQTSGINQSTEKVLFNSNVYSGGMSVSSTGVELVSLSPVNFYSINSGASSSFPSNFKVLNNKLFFAATNDLTGRELWVHDGTNTSLCFDLIVGTSNSNPNTLTVMGTNLYYFITNNLGQTELIKTNGTLANTYIVAGANGPDGLLISSSSGMVAINGKLFFTAKRVNASVGYELYAYNGSSVYLVADIIAGIGDGAPSNLFGAGNNLFFTATTVSTGRELCRYNDIDGTTLVKDINPGPAGSSITEMFAISANEIYFQADNLSNGYELWRSDGTPTGTYLIKDINIGGSSYPAKFCKLGSWVYFRANDGKHNTELWRTNGTFSGTTLVYDFNPDIGQNQNNGQISDIIATTSKLYISANNGRNGHQLFEYTPCQIEGNNGNFSNYVANRPSQTTHFTNSLYLYAKFYENRNLSFFSEKSIFISPGFEIDASKNQVFQVEIKNCF